MTSQDLQELERDIERSRAQLDNTIDRLQDKMTVSGVVDDVLGTARNGQYGASTTAFWIRSGAIPCR